LTGSALRGSEIRYEEFVSREFFAKLTKGLTREERAALKAPLVHQEVGVLIFTGDKLA
jgi:hypothetical protein